MIFVDKIWLIAAFVSLPALAALHCQLGKGRQRKLAAFASTRLLADLVASLSPGKRTVKATLFATGVGFVLLALARPQWGYHWQETKGRGIDILVTLDTSKSMLAEDVKPNRLERAKLAILDLVHRLEGDRIGLIAFAGSAFLQCPLTLDYDAYRQTLEVVDTGIIARGGTDIASAIAEAQASFAKDDNFKILVLITDGEDLEASGIEQARTAAEAGVKIYTVGVGSSAGELIPLRQPDGTMDFFRDSNGNIVKTRLDAITLTEIATATGGFYVPLGNTGQGLEKVYEQGLQFIPKQERKARLQKVPRERFQWPLGLALLALSAEILVGTRRRTVRCIPIPLRWAAILTLVLLPTFIQRVGGASPQKAEKLYHSGKFGEAGEYYREAIEKTPQDTRLHYNLGAAEYRAGEFNKAQKALQKALATDDLALQGNAFYNLGNTRYRMGEATLSTNPQKTIEIWEKALKDYENTLNLNPQDEDAQFNYAFLKKRLEVLKQQQQRQQKGEQGREQNRDQENQDEQQKRDQQEQHDQPQGQNDQKPKSQDQNQEQRSSHQEESKPQEQDHRARNQDEQEQKQETIDQPQPSQGSSREEPREEASQGLPGQMTREEARQLLEAMKSLEKKLPITGFEKLKPSREEEGVEKDW